MIFLTIDCQIMKNHFFLHNIFGGRSNHHLWIQPWCINTRGSVQYNFLYCLFLEVGKVGIRKSVFEVCFEFIKLVFFISFIIYIMFGSFLEVRKGGKLHVGAGRKRRWWFHGSLCLRIVMRRLEMHSLVWIYIIKIQLIILWKTIILKHQKSW